jgi:hypothetical protein
MSGGVSGASVNITDFYGDAGNADVMADRINARLCAGEMAAADRARIRDYLLPNTPTESRRREALGLAIGSPSFQWY